MLNILLGFVLGIVGKSTDSSPLSSYPLKDLPSVTDLDNAFSILPKQSDDYDKYDLRYEVSALLVESWNTQKAQQLLADNHRYLDLLRQANSIGFIHSEPSWNQFGISHGALELIAGLNRLESRVYAEQGDMNEAFQSWKRGLIFAEMIKKDAVLTPHSFWRGTEMVDKQLSFLHSLISRHKISGALLKQAFEQLETVSDLKDDDYGLVYSGEFRMLKSALQGLGDEPLWKRIRYIRYFGMKDFVGEPQPLFVRIVRDWGRIFAPRYFIQKESSLNSYRPVLSGLQTQVGIICTREMDWGELNFVATVPRWYDVFKPNSSSKQQVVTRENYRDRSEQRCLMSMHLRALKLNIAIRRYEQERQKPLQNLLELVPDFIDQLSIDPMSNKPLIFDKATKSIVSVGTDAVHGELGEGKVYSSKCSRSTACRLNPLVPFDYQDVRYHYGTSEWDEMFNIESDDLDSEFENVE